MRAQLIGVPFYDERWSLGAPLVAVRALVAGMLLVELE
jgi:hypothetical protein